MNFTARVHVAGLLALALAGCYDGLGRQDSMSGTGSVSVSVTGITAGPTEVTGASGPTEAGESGTAGVTGSGGSTQSSSGGESSGGAPKFDLGEQPTVDLGGEMMGPIIPTTCAEASSGKSTVGCKFFAVDMDAHDQVETSQYAVGVANVQLAAMANVTVEVKENGAWQVIGGAAGDRAAAAVHLQPARPTHR